MKNDEMSDTVTHQDQYIRKKMSCLFSAQCFEPNMQGYYEWQNEQSNKQHKI